MTHISHIRRIQHDYGVVGREREIALSLAILESGRHLLFEGPVGVGKTTVALAVCRHIGRETVRVDGDDRYSEAKLTGWFDPPLVLKLGYTQETFFPGPLVRAMTHGAALFINELNRMPESVQNVLLPALDERLLILPRIDEVHAVDGFQVIATQNPHEYIGTGHLSEALRDRFEHITLDYQTAADEAAIVMRETGSDDYELVLRAVTIARMTRSDPTFKKGASVRAAIAIAAMTERLTGSGMEQTAALLEAALAALMTRTELRDEIDADLAGAIASIVAAAQEQTMEQMEAMAEPATAGEETRSAPKVWGCPGASPRATRQTTGCRRDQTRHAAARRSHRRRRAARGRARWVDYHRGA